VELRPIAGGVSINRDEWLRALADAGYDDKTDDQGAVTVAEFAEMFGLQRNAAERRLLRLEALGKATRTRKIGPRADGKRLSMVAFRLA
jgi:hypothetical protein